MKTSSNRQSIVHFRKSGSLNLMAMSVLIESSEQAVGAHAQYKIGPKEPRTSGATWGGLQVAMHSQLLCFLVMYECRTDLLIRL